MEYEPLDYNPFNPSSETFYVYDDNSEYIMGKGTKAECDAEVIRLNKKDPKRRCRTIDCAENERLYDAENALMDAMITCSQTIKSLVGATDADAPEWTTKLRDLLSTIPVQTLCKLEQHIDKLRIAKQYGKPFTEFLDGKTPESHE